MPDVSNLYSFLQRAESVAATHSGSFHADDVLAAAALRLVNPALPVHRTRDRERLNAAHILFDVGRVYDPVCYRFDHHQPEYGEKRENGIPYSSFGLIWRELGVLLCGSEGASSRVDRLLVQGVDALDCGINLSKEIPRLSVLSISSAIGSFNPGWQEDCSPGAQDKAFERAINWAQSVLQNIIREAIGQEAARGVVEQGILSQAGRLLVLDCDVPWKETVLSSPDYKQVLYVITPDTQAKWHVHAVPDYAGSFNNRQSLPAAWAGLEGEDLDGVTGIQGCIFCHRGRFVAGHGNRDGALAMAQLALRS